MLWALLTGSTARRILLVGAVLAAGCGGDDQDHDGAVALYARVAGHEAWTRAPDYPTRRPSFTAHSDAVDIYVNGAIERVLAGPAKAETWPVGAVIVKDGFTRGGSKTLTAIMEKRADGWFFAEYDADGAPLFSGRPKICVDCHDNRASYSDWLYTVELPR